MSRWVAFVPLVALLLIVIAGAVLLTRPGAQPTFTTGMVGQPAPAYALPRLGEGAQVTSAGRPRSSAYVINMFASWCVPCRAEHDQLLAMKADGVDIVGIAYKDAPDDTSRFLQELGDPYSAVAMDRDGRFALQFGLTGVPETYVIGPDGRVRIMLRGPLTADIVQRQILPALR